MKIRADELPLGHLVVTPWGEELTVFSVTYTIRGILVDWGNETSSIFVPSFLLDVPHADGKARRVTKTFKSRHP